MTDLHGNPVSGAVLRLLPAAGKSADSEVSTDSTGRAKVVWTLGRTAGLQRLTARLQGDTADTELTAVARPGKAVKLAFVNPPESGKPGRALPKPLVVQVTDSYGNPLAGQTVVFKATSGPASDWLDPTARNSNLFPVKAKGLVRLRSPASLGRTGNVSTPTVRVPLALLVLAPPALICSKMSVS